MSKQQALAKECFLWLSIEDGEGGVTNRRGYRNGFLSFRVFCKQACWIACSREIWGWAESKKHTTFGEFRV